LNDENKPRDISDVESMVIPDGTPFVIVDLDRENERVHIEFALDGKVMRGWVATSLFEKLAKN
jgi:hypothetical protein